MKKKKEKKNKVVVAVVAVLHYEGPSPRAEKIRRGVPNPRQNLDFENGLDVIA